MSELPEIDQVDFDAKEEFAIIQNMVKRAKEYNLVEEVVYSFYQAIRNGDKLEEAIWFAFCEWDV